MIEKLKSSEISKLLAWMEAPACRKIYLKVLGEREALLFEQMLSSPDNREECAARIREIRQFVVFHDLLLEELQSRKGQELPSALDEEEKLLK